MRELELAYLAGGERRLGDAVLLSLASNNAATIAPGDHRITIIDQRPLATLIERPPHLPVQPGMTRQQFQTALAPLAGRMKTRLQTLGYCPTDAQVTAFRGSVLPFVGLLLLFGIAKVVLGIERNHAVGFLITLLIVTFIAAIALAKPPIRTRAGTDALRSYQTSHARAALRRATTNCCSPWPCQAPWSCRAPPMLRCWPVEKLSGSGSGDGGGGCGGGGGGCGGCS